MNPFVILLATSLVGAGIPLSQLKAVARADGESLSGKIYLLRNAKMASIFVKAMIDQCVKDDDIGKTFDVVISIEGSGRIANIWSFPSSRLTDCAKHIDVRYLEPPKSPFLLNFQIAIKREHD